LENKSAKKKKGYIYSKNAKKKSRQIVVHVLSAFTTLRRGYSSEQVCEYGFFVTRLSLSKKIKN